MKIPKEIIRILEAYSMFDNDIIIVKKFLLKHRFFAIMDRLREHNKNRIISKFMRKYDIKSLNQMHRWLKEWKEIDKRTPRVCYFCGCDYLLPRDEYGDVDYCYHCTKDACVEKAEAGMMRILNAYNEQSGTASITTKGT